MMETILEAGVGVLAVMGVIIAGTLTLQFANNASRNMSLTNSQSSENISKAATP